MVQRCQVRALLVVALILFSVTCGLSSLSWAVLLRQRLEGLQAATVGDPEKAFVDECTRDFAGLQTQDSKYLAAHRQCLEQLVEMERFRWLPRVRLTVDERICDPANLCSGRDPETCGDRGDAGQQDFIPGDVSECFDLINKARMEQVTRHTTDLLDLIESRCTDPSRWKGYVHGVRIHYCMWKHQSGGGVCMNSMLTNCPKDSSCCPVAQNHIGTNGNLYAPRPDWYVCRKSPSIGLFCQRSDDFAPANVTGADPSGLCTEATCPSFAWCQDLADVPGLCLGEACRSLRRSLVYAALLAALAALGLVLDAAGLVVFVRYPEAANGKAVLVAAAGFLKLGSSMLLLAAGIIEFLDTTISRTCFNAEGNTMVKGLRAGVNAYLLTTLLSAGGSFSLAPFAAYRLADVTSLPYAHVKNHN